MRDRTFSPDDIRRLRGTRSRPRFGALIGVSANTVYRWELEPGSPHHLKPSPSAREALLRLAEDEVAPERIPAPRTPPGPRLARGELASAFALLAEARYAEAHAELEARIAAGLAPDRLAEARALQARAALLGGGDAGRALELLEPWATEGARDALSDPPRALVHLWLGHALGWRDGSSHDRASALSLLHAARTEMTRLEERAGTFWAELGLGLVHFSLNDLDVARRHFAACLTLELPAGQPALSIWSNEAAAHLARAEGDYRRSALEHGRSLHLALQAADRYARARALAFLCERRLEAGDPVRDALAAGEEARRLFATLGDPLDPAQVTMLRALGESWLGTGQFNDIRDILGGAVVELESRGASPYLLREILGRCAVREGRPAEARVQLSAIRSLGGSVGRSFGLALADQLEAAILGLEGGHEAAAAAWAAARATAERIGSVALCGDAEVGRTEALVAAGDLVGAREALAAAERILAQVRAPFLHACLDRARAMLLHAEGRHAAARAQLAHARDALIRTCDEFDARRCETLLASWPEAVEPEGAGLPVTVVERIAAAASGGSAHVIAELAACLGDALPGAGVSIFDGGGSRLAASGAAPAEGQTAGPVFGDRQGRRYQLAVRGAEPPVWLAALLAVAELALQAASVREEAAAPVDDDPFAGIVVGSSAMRAVLEKLRKLRASGAPVLVLGESGVGKELIARAIHRIRARRGRLVSVNCAAVPRSVFEAQLFGHVRGAFTGAEKDATGFVRSADCGTLFLDEIGELPLELQPKLLRFLQEGEIHPVGAERPVRVDVRVVSATNRNLEEAVRAGRFREDLYYRLHVVPIQVPPLRERLEELPLLAAHFLRQLRGSAAPRIAEDALAALASHPWPGNVRQLRNELERIVALHEVDVITREHLDPVLFA